MGGRTDEQKLPATFYKGKMGAQKNIPIIWMAKFEWQNLLIIFVTKYSQDMLGLVG